MHYKVVIKILESESDVKVDNFQKHFNSTPKFVVDILEFNLVGHNNKNGTLIVVLSNRLVGMVT